jgi:hypothetical protein
VTATSPEVQLSSIKGNYVNKNSRDTKYEPLSWGTLLIDNYGCWSCSRITTVTIKWISEDSLVQKVYFYYTEQVAGFIIQNFQPKKLDKF